MSRDLWVVRESGAEVQVKWGIEHFLSLAEGPGLFLFLHSPFFSLSGAQWFLEMWLNDRGFTRLSLRKRFSTSETHCVRYTFGIRSTDGSVYKSIDGEGEFKKHSGGKLHKLVPVSELRGSRNVLSADGFLTAFATLRLAEPTLPDDIARALPLRATHTEEVSTEWKVEGFASLPKEPGFSLDSPTFSFAGAEWCLRVYPYGRGFVGSVSLFLKESSSSKEQTVAYTLGIRRRNGNPYRLFHGEGKFRTGDERGCWGLFKPFELLDSPNGLVHRGSVTFFCTLRADTPETLTERATPTSSGPNQEEKASQTTPSEGGEHSQSTCATLHEDYRTFFLKESLGDVSIRVRDQKLPAHRAILAARSSVFTAMFEHDTEERRTGTVDVDDFDPEPFRSFLTFLYSGDVDAVTADNAISLYEASDKYNVQDLRKECLKHLRNALCVGSFCQVAQLAFVHSDRVLLDTATEFFVEHAKEIVVTPEWHAMVKEHPDLTTELIIQMVTHRP